MYRISTVMMSLALIAVSPLLALRAGEFDAEARARVLAPFVDEQTVAVVHIDLSRIEADALMNWAIEAGQLEKRELELPRRALSAWLSAFTKVGGKDLYVVLSWADSPLESPLVVVPVAAGANAEAVRLVLRSVKPFEQLNFEKADRVLVGGGVTARKRLRNARPAARPELARAFAAAGDTFAQLLLLPTPDTRRVIDELIPSLPPEAGGGSTRPLTHGLVWAALGADLPPKLSVRLTIQSPDADAAQALRDFLARILKPLAGAPDVRGFLPGIERLAENFTPQVEGDKLTLSGKDKELLEYTQTVVRIFYQGATRRNAEHNLHRLAIALINYGDVNKGQLPAIANFDKQGQPLLSWRVHMLPYLGEEKLYKEFHLDESWDSPHNKKLLARMPAVYQGPNRRLNEEGKTILLVPVGKDVAFTGGPERRIFPKDFPDGTSNTLFIVEADDAHAVEWTKPGDLKIDLNNPHQGLGGHFGDAFLAAMADSSVRLIAKGVSKATLRAAFTTAGGDILGSDW